ncbi:MAG: cyclic nucleotide-binding domain-containing protein [Ignavibacteria bacterium]
MSEPRKYRRNTVRASEILWNFLVAAGMLVLAYRIPVELVLPSAMSSSWQIVIALVGLVLVADPIIKYRKNKARGDEHADVYRRFHFIVDLLVLVPLLLPANSPLRLLVLLKIITVHGFIRQWMLQMYRGNALIRFGQFAYILAVTIHLVACGWLALQIPTQKHFGSYLHAVYWAVSTLCTVGYGDITPNNDTQMMYATVVMICGYVLFAWLIGNIASILNRVDPIHSEHAATMERVTSFLRFHRVPQSLQVRIIDYLSYMWDRKVGSDEPSLLKLIPWGMRSEVSMYLRRDLLERVHFLKDASDALLREISDAGRAIVVTPGEYVFHVDDSPRYMYFISTGMVEAISRDGLTLGTLTTGDFFGEMALLEKRNRNVSIRALEYCDLFVLDARTFDRVIESYPEFRTVISNVARERAASTSELVRSIQ